MGRLAETHGGVCKRGSPGIRQVGDAAGQNQNSVGWVVRDGWQARQSLTECTRV